MNKYRFFKNGYDQAIRIIICRLRRRRKTAVFTPNAEILALAERNIALQDALMRADLLIPDGIGAYISASLNGIKLYERTNGIDLAERIMKDHAERLSVFLLGAKEGVAEEAANGLRKRYPDLCIVGAHHGYFSEGENENVIKAIDRSGANTLFVCLGSPKQEIWIDLNLRRLKKVYIAIGLGGSLDIWSERIRRAPAPWRACGLEWAWRMIKEPRRIKRLISAFCRRKQ